MQTEILQITGETDGNRSLGIRLGETSLHVAQSDDNGAQHNCGKTMGRPERRHGYHRSQAGNKVPSQVYALLVLCTRQSAQGQGRRDELKQRGQVGGSG